MKKELLQIVLACIFLCSFGLLLGQDPSEPIVANGDTLVIPPTYNGNPINALNNWILWDHDGDLNNAPKHAVYKLLRNQRYPITSEININGRLSLVADKPDLDNKPPQLGKANDENGNTTKHMIKGGPFTFKNIWFSELNWTTLTNAEFGLMIRLTVDSTNNYFDGCYFEHIRGIVMKATSGKENNIYFTNCFLNDCGRGADRIWQGHLFNGGETLTQDSVIYRNNTFINTPGNFFNNRKNMTRYVEITHNTLINTTANPFFSTFWIEAHIKNNLLVNVYSVGEDDNYRLEQEPDALSYSIINIDTLANEWPMNDTTWYERESDRVFEVSHNYYGWHDDFEAFWDSRDTIYPPEWMNSRTLAMFADDDNYPGLTETGTMTKADLGLPEFETPIQGTDEMLRFVQEVIWGDATEAIRWVWEPEGAPIPNNDLDWPPLEDLRLTSTEFVGDDGLPLGDLNWYEQWATRWDMTGWGRETVGVYNAATESFTLDQNYPNPFSNKTNIRFNLNTSEMVRLTVYDHIGRMIKTLKNGPAAAGINLVRWDGTSSSGNELPSGIYFFQLETENQVVTKKMIKVK